MTENKSVPDRERSNIRRFRRFLHSQRGSRLTVLLLLVLMLFAVLGVHYVLEDWRVDHVTRIAVSQDEDALNIKWNRIRSKAYRVDVFQDGKKFLSQKTGVNHYRLEGIDYLHDYKITIYGKTDAGGYVRGVSEVFYTRNPQKIQTEVKKAEGFAGDSVDLEAKADVGLIYESGNEAVATVSEDGIVSFVKAGETEIKITAPENEDNIRDTIAVPAVCYPKSLPASSVKLKKTGDTSAVLRISKVQYAETYELLRAVPGSDEYEKYREIKAKEFGKSKTCDIEIAKEIGSYSVRAAAKAGKERLESEMSDPVSIEPGFDSASTYSSITTVIEIGSDDVDRVVSASGSGSASVAQSMCCTDDGYVVAFVNRGNSTGCLKKYDWEGKETAVNADTGHIGHANGCTYDPKTNRIYVMKTYASGKYHDIRAFDADTLESTDSVSFGTAPSGIGYDPVMKQFYMTASSRIYVTDEDLGMIRTITRKRAYRSQDVAGYNGIVLSCIWTGGSGSYIDMYRALNGDYLGSIYAPFGEIESACVEDGYLVMLYNGGSVYRTKERVDFPG